MDKRAVIKDLHMMMFARLFSDRPWLVDAESGPAIDRKLLEMGVQERAPGDGSATRFTTLGKELSMDLVMVFIGLWDEFEMVSILDEHDLIDEFDCERIYHILENHENPERLLLPIVQKAFLDHYNPSGFLV